MQEHLKDLRAGGRPMTAKEKLQRENEKLQNNWNELKKWLEEQEQRAWDEVSSTFGYVLDKMQELECNDENNK